MISSTKTISVVIPCYNAAPYIGQAVESALQTNLAIQILVVDDASTDDSLEVLDAYRKHIQLIRLECNSGPSAARNSAIPFLEAKYTLFLDADDAIAPHGLEILNGAMNGSTDTIVYGSYELRDQSFGKLLSRETPPIIHDPVNDFSAGNIAPPGCFLLPTCIFGKVGTFSPDLKGCEDWDLWLRAAEAGYKFRRVQPSVFRYRRHPGTLSTRALAEFISGMQVIRRSCERRYGDCNMENAISDLAAKCQLIENIFCFGGRQFGLASLQNDEAAMAQIMALIPIPDQPPIDKFIVGMKNSIFWNAISLEETADYACAATLRAIRFLGLRHPGIFPYHSAMRAAFKPDWKSLIRRPGPKKAIRLIHEALLARRCLKQLHL